MCRRTDGAAGEEIKNANVFIANLPKTVDEDQLKSMFSSHGQIIRSKILVDHNSGVSKGCGFILYSKTSEADDAISGKRRWNTAVFYIVLLFLSYHLNSMRGCIGLSVLPLRWTDAFCPNPELNGTMAPGSTNLMTVKKAQDSEQTKAMKHGQVQVIHHYAPYPGAGIITLSLHVLTKEMTLTSAVIVSDSDRFASSTPSSISPPHSLLITLPSHHFHPMKRHTPVLQLVPSSLTVATSSNRQPLYSPDPVDVANSQPL